MVLGEELEDVSDIFFVHGEGELDIVDPEIVLAVDLRRLLRVLDVLSPPLERTFEETDGYVHAHVVYVVLVVVTVLDRLIVVPVVRDGVVIHV